MEPRFLEKCATLVCSHMAAILFKIEAAVNLGITSCSSTQEACKWNNSFQKEIHPRPLSQFKELTMHNRKKDVRIMSYLPCAPLPNVHTLSRLKEVLPNAAFFSLITKLDKDDTDSASEDEWPANDLPEPITDIFSEEHASLRGRELQEKCMDTMIGLVEKTTICDVQALENATRDQHTSDVWTQNRYGRITASRAHKVYTRRPNCDPIKLIEHIMGYDVSDNSHVPALKWGRECEEKARKQYIEFMKNEHDNFTCRKSGLRLSINEPYIGASADAIASCACHGTKVVEIKCPYKHRNHHPNEASSVDAEFCLTSDLKLKKSHPYYTQVQMQMYCNQMNVADFVVFTNNALVVDTSVTLDEDFCRDVVSSCKNFFVGHVLPEILTRRIKCAIVYRGRR